MAENQKKNMNKKVIAGVIALVAVIVALVTVFCVFREKPVQDAKAITIEGIDNEQKDIVQGAKAITIEVIDNEQKSIVYEVHTDAEYLRQAMEEADGLTVEGTESIYGLMVETVNGVTADYNVDGAYWAFYVNDTYCNYGVDEQPVADGDAFQIKYEAAQ